jgi:hypothetical protein
VLLAQVMRNRHFGVLATDLHSSVVMRGVELNDNGMYGAGVGAGAQFTCFTGTKGQILTLLLLLQEQL